MRRAVKVLDTTELAAVTAPRDHERASEWVDADMNAAVDMRAIHGSQDEFVNEAGRAAGPEKSKRYGLFIAVWEIRFISA